MKFAKVILLFLGFFLMKEAGAQSVVDTICIDQGSSHFGVPPVVDVTYHWTVGGGRIISGQGTSEIDVLWGNVPGYHLVELYVTNEEGCTSDPQMVYVFLKYADYSHIKGPTVVCAGTEVILEGNDGPNLIWNDGKSKKQQQFIVNSDTTLYQVALNGPCENDTFYHHITALPAPVAGMNPVPDSVELNHTLDLFYMGSNADNIQWVINDWEIGDNYYEEYQFSKGGEYDVWLIAQTGTCTDTIKNKIFVRDDFVVHIPTAFTPNGDGTNDRFLFYGVGMKKYEARIYDRWGTVLHRWTDEDMNPGWNGFYKGESVKMDSYVYKIVVEDYRGIEHNYSGTVTVLY